MRRLHVTVVDLTTERPARALYARLMNANLAGIMPQVVAVWCEQAGHHVHYVCYTGFEDLPQEVLGPADIVFIGAFTQAAHTAYAISDLHRRRGAITVLGGPHTRCYPLDAVHTRHPPRRPGGRGRAADGPGQHFLRRPGNVVSRAHPPASQ